MAKQLNYQVNLSVNKNDLNELLTALKQIQQDQIKALNLGTLTSDLDKAGDAAYRLEQILNKSWNSKIGQLDLSKLNTEIKNTYGSVSKLKENLESAGMGQYFNQLQSNVLNTNLQLKNTNKLLDAMATSMANTVKWGITSSIFNNITSQIQKAWSYSKSLDTSLNSIRIVTGKSADEMERYARVANKAAKDLGQSTRDYTNASLIYYQQGLGEEETQARTETTLKAANVTGQTGQEVSEQLTAVWNGYKVSAEETELYVDKLAAVAAGTAADLEELSTGMSKVASAANSAGVDIDQLNGILSTVISVTREAPETIGSAFKTIFARLGDLALNGEDEYGVSLGKVSGQLHELGIEVLDQKGEMRDMGDIIEDTAAKWQTWTKAQRQAAAVAMAGKMQYSRLIALFDNWDMYSKAVETSSNAIGTLQEQQDIYMESTEAHLKKLSTEAERTYDILFDTNAVNDMSDALTGLLKIFNNFLAGMGGGLQTITGLTAMAGNIFNKQIGAGINQLVQNRQIGKQNEQAVNTALAFSQEAASKTSSEAESKVYEDMRLKSQEILALKERISTEDMNRLLTLRKEAEQESLITAALEEQNTRQTSMVAIENSLKNQSKLIKEQKREYAAITENVEMIEQRRGSRYVEDRNQMLESQKDILSRIAMMKDEELLTDEQIAILEKAKQRDDQNRVLTEKQIADLQNISQQVIEQEVQKEKEITRQKELQQQLDNGALEVQQIKSQQKQQALADAQANLKRQAAIQDMVKGLTALITLGTTFSGIWKTINNEELTGWEKFEQISSTLLITLPMLIKNLSVFPKLLPSVATALGATALAENATGKEALAAQIKVLGLQMTLGQFLIVIGAVVAILAVLGIAISAAIQEQEKYNKAAEDAKLRANELAEAYNNVKESYEALKSSITEYQSMEKALKTMTKGTEEWNEQVMKLNDSVLELIRKYPTLMDYMTSEDGVLGISEEGFKAISNKIQKQAVQAQVASLYGQQDVYRTAGQAAIDNFRKDNSFMAFGSHRERMINGDYYDKATSREDLNEGLKRITDLISSNQAGYLKGELDEEIKSIGADLGVSNMTTALDNNRDKLYDLSQSMQGYQKSIDTYSDTIITILGKDNTAYQASENKDLINKNMQGIADEQYNKAKSEADKMSNEELAQYWINNLAPDDVQNASYRKHKFFNEAHTLSYNQGGEKKEIDLATLQQLVASDKAQKATDSLLTSKTYSTDSVVDLLNENTAGMGRFMEQIATGKNVINEYTKEQIQHYQEAWNTWLQNATDAEKEGIQNFMGKTDELTSSVQNAFNNGKSSQEIADYYKSSFNANSVKQGYNKSITEVGAKIQSGDLDYSNIGEDEDYQNVLSGLNDLKRAYPEVTAAANVLNKTWLVGTQEYAEALEIVQDQLYKAEMASMTDEANSHIDNLIDKVSEANWSVDLILDDGEFQQEINELLNQEYSIDVAIHTEAEQEFDSIVSAMENMQKQASAIGENYVVAADKIRELNNVFPGIIQNMRDLGDGTIQLNKEIVQSAIGTAQAEIAADSQATVNKLRNQAELLRQKQVVYQNMANAASALAQMEVGNDEAASEQRAIISENLAELKGINDKLETQTELDNQSLVADSSNQNGQITASNWSKAYQSAAQSSYKFAQDAINNMRAASGQGAPSLSDYGVNYSGSSGQSSEAKVLEGTQSMLDNASNQTSEKWAQLAQSYQQLADSAGAAANDIDGMIAQIGASNVDIGNQLGNIKSGKGANPKKSGGGGSKASEPDKMETLEDKPDVYHDVNIQLELISKNLDKIQSQADKLFGQNLIDNLNEQLNLLNEQIDTSNKKINIARGEAARLKNELSGQGVTFNADGTIANYANAYNAQLAYVNSIIANYNSMTKEQQDAYKDTVEQAKKDFEDFKKALDEYDNTITNTIPDLEKDIQDAVDKQIEIKIKEFTMEIEIRLDMSEAERDWNEFRRKVIDGVKDTDILGNARARLRDFNSYYNRENTGEVQSLMKQVANTQAQLEQMDRTGWSDFYGDNRAQGLEDLKSYNDQLMKSMEDVEDLIEEIKKSYLDMMDEAADKFQDQVNMYEQVKDIIDHDMNIIKLVYGEDSYADLEKYYQMQEDNNNKQLDFLRQQKDFWYAQMQTLEQGSEEWEKAKENWMDAVSEWNSKVEEAVENIQDKYLNTINKIFDELNNKVTSGAGLDYVSEEWELINKNADQYLDTINSLYGIQSLENKYLDAIDKTDNLSAQRKLNDLMNEELDALREKDKLTQYDIDRANMKYEIALKQIALEEAQQNKSTMRLRRDSQGNYTYQYVADNDQIGQIQDELTTLKNELYNFDLEHYRDNLDQVLEIYQEFQEKMKEAAQINDPEERAAMELLLQEQYGELINGLVEQNETIRLNLHESAFTELADLYNTDLNNFQSLTSEEQEVLLGQMIPQWDSGIQHMSDTFAGEGGFIPTCKDAMEQLNAATETYEQDLNQVQQAAGQDFGDVQRGIDDTKTKTEELIQDNGVLIQTYQDQLNEVRKVINELQSLRSEYDSVKIAAQQAAEAAYNYWRAVNGKAANAAGNNVSGGNSNSGNSSSNSRDSNTSSLSSGSGGAGSVGGDGATIGNQITYSGSYYYDSFGTKPSGSKYSGVADGVTIDIVNNNPYGIHIKSSDGRYPDLGWIKRNQVTRWNTGGYTGDWGDDSGRLAILDRKELILNKDDTANMLNILQLTRDFMNSMNNVLLSRIINSVNGAPNTGMGMVNEDTLEQNVHIDATFPNVKDAREVEEALNNLVNVASQRIGRNTKR